MRSQLSKQTVKGGRVSSLHGRKPGSAPEIPDKLYFRIGDVAKLCSVQAYVLRFWESEFPQLKPGKSGTGQRLYRRRDVEMALKIKHLLYEEGYTIAGARHAFQHEARNGSVERVAHREKQPELPLGANLGRPSPVKVQRLKSELREILGMLSKPVSLPRLVTRESAPLLKPQLFE